MSSKKLQWANDLRAFAVIGVIVLHVASSISLDYPNISNSYFLTSLGFDCAVRWCVPVFVMLSGSFALESYDGRLKHFFSKMFYRIILPFLFWSIVYLFAFSWKELTLAKNVHDLMAFIGRQFMEGTASHLWYVYMIVSLYLAFPLLSKWTRQAEEKEYIYFLSIWIVLIALDPFLSRNANNFDFGFFMGYLGFIVLGNYLIKTQRKVNRILLFILFLAALVYTILRSYFLSVQERQMNEKFMENLSVNVIVMAACIYLFVKESAFPPGSRWRKLLDLVADNSYGIYLSHLLLLNAFMWLGWSFYFIHPLFSVPIISLACLILSTGLILLMKKVPVLKKVAG
jgi:surface polysaccharide O-acyltransferase-like enzyme